MWQKIIEALITELEKNPDQVIGLVETILGLVKNNPAAQKALIDIARAQLIHSTTVAK